jgi:hypothetical protein
MESSDEEDTGYESSVVGQALGPIIYDFTLADALKLGIAAVVELGHLRLKGFVGWMFWSAVHIYFLLGIGNRFVVAISWLWSYLTFQRRASYHRGLAKSSRQINFWTRPATTIGFSVVGTSVTSFDLCCRSTARPSLSAVRGNSPRDANALSQLVLAD